MDSGLGTRDWRLEIEDWGTRKTELEKKERKSVGNLPVFHKFHASRAYIMVTLWTAFFRKGAEKVC